MPERGDFAATGSINTSWEALQNVARIVDESIPKIKRLATVFHRHEPPRTSSISFVRRVLVFVQVRWSEPTLSRALNRVSHLRRPRHYDRRRRMLTIFFRETRFRIRA